MLSRSSSQHLRVYMVGWPPVLNHSEAQDLSNRVKSAVATAVDMG